MLTNHKSLCETHLLVRVESLVTLIDLQARRTLDKFPGFKRHEARQ